MSHESAADRPAAEGIAAGQFPPSAVEPGHTAPCARRVRAFFNGECVVDTLRATYVWEHRYYPRWYVPAADVDAALIVDEGKTTTTMQGDIAIRTLVVGDERVPHAARYLASSASGELDDTYVFTWQAMDQWFEEDEEVFVHPRSPYVRVDAVRSTRRVQVRHGDVVLAESPVAVAVFETQLPTRWYLDPSAVRWNVLVPSETETECPYKGRTSGYWSTDTGEGPQLSDVAWSYDFPTRQLSPVAGLVAFLDEKVTVLVDGVPTR